VKGPKRSGFEAEISGFRRTDPLGSFRGPGGRSLPESDPEASLESLGV